MPRRWGWMICHLYSPFIKGRLRARRRRASVMVVEVALRFGETSELAYKSERPDFSLADWIRTGLFPLSQYVLC